MGEESRADIVVFRKAIGRLIRAARHQHRYGCAAYTRIFLRFQQIRAVLSVPGHCFHLLYFCFYLPDSIPLLLQDDDSKVEFLSITARKTISAAVFAIRIKISAISINIFILPPSFPFFSISTDYYTAPLLQDDYAKVKFILQNMD